MIGRSGPAYAASKGKDTIALTKWVAREIGQYNITCNSVAPGQRKLLLQEDSYYDTGHQPINRMGQPDEMCRSSCKLFSFKRCWFYYWSSDCR